jgi:hypothetical protein
MGGGLGGKRARSGDGAHFNAAAALLTAAADETSLDAEIAATLLTAPAVYNGALQELRAQIMGHVRLAAAGVLQPAHLAASLKDPLLAAVCSHQVLRLPLPLPGNGQQNPQGCDLGSMGPGAGMTGDTRRGSTLMMYHLLLALVGTDEAPGARIWDMGSCSGAMAFVLCAAARGYVDVVCVEHQPFLHGAALSGLLRRLRSGFFAGTGAPVPLMLRCCIATELVGLLVHEMRTADVPPTLALVGYTEGMRQDVLVAFCLCARALGAIVVIVTNMHAQLALVELCRGGSCWCQVADFDGCAVGSGAKFKQIVFARLDLLARTPAERATWREGPEFAAERDALKRAVPHPPPPATGVPAPGLAMVGALTMVARGVRGVVPDDMDDHNALVMDVNFDLVASAVRAEDDAQLRAATRSQAVQPPQEEEEGVRARAAALAEFAAEAAEEAAAQAALGPEGRAAAATAAREALVQRLARRRHRLDREDRVVALRAQALAVRRAALETAEHEAAGPL